MKRRISRKEFLCGTCQTMIAASAGALAMSVVKVSGEQLPGRAGVIDKAATSWPWPYRTLDPEDVRKRGHKMWYDGACGYGAFNAIVSSLAEKVGEPFASIPPQMLFFCGGGGAGWGTLCGSLNGAAIAIGLVVDRTNTNLLVSELLGWYCTAALPTDISNGYAQQRVMLVNKMDKAVGQNAAGSPLCHPSVSQWSGTSGFGANSPERAERCARLTGDTAAKAVQLLNAHFSNQFKAQFVVPESVKECMNCHSTTTVFTGVKMDCEQCHRMWGPGSTTE